MLVIFVVETNSKNESDKMYISKFLDVFYSQSKSTVKYDYVFLNGKGNYSTRGTQTKIDNKQKSYLSYQTNKKEKTKVIYCIDIDDLVDPDNKEYNKKINEEISNFCSSKGYEFVWFYRNIEDVFLGKTVSKSDKKKEAVRFFNRRLSANDFDKKNYESIEFNEAKRHTTNLEFVLSNVFNSVIHG